VFTKPGKASTFVGREKIVRISNLSGWVWQSSISSVGREESLVKRLRIDHSRFTHGQLLRGKPASVCTSCRRPSIPSCLYPMTRNSTPFILTVSCAKYLDPETYQCSGICQQCRARKLLLLYTLNNSFNFNFSFLLILLELFLGIF